MATIRTDLGTTRERARELRYEPSGTIRATNVQEAIEEFASTPVGLIPTSVTVLPYTTLPSDTLVNVNAAAGTITLDDPANHGGAEIVIHDISGAADPNIVITGTIEGGFNLEIHNPYGGVRLRASAATWRYAP